MSLNCTNCGEDNADLARKSLGDVMICPKCWKNTPTGKEPEYREHLEGSKTWVENYPRIAGGRAAFYSNSIYKLANKADPFLFDKIESAIYKKFAGRKAKMVGMNGISGRQYGDMIDAGVGALVLGLDDGINKFVYVIFRGSVGAKKKRGNMGAGRDRNDTSRNIDWRVNFDNKLVRARWGPPSVKVHRGFHEVYESYSEQVHRAMYAMRGRLNGAQVIITGHSQGAAHAVMCAHHLSHLDPALAPMCLPFSSPRVGNLHFAMDFNMRIASQESYVASDQNDFPRCIIAVQMDDQVWKGQRHSFKDHISLKDRKRADGAGILPKAIHASRRSLDDVQIFYHVKYFYKAARFGMHHPGAMQKSMLS